MHVTICYSKGSAEIVILSCSSGVGKRSHDATWPFARGIRSRPAPPGARSNVQATPREAKRDIRTLSTTDQVRESARKRRMKRLAMPTTKSVCRKRASWRPRCRVCIPRAYLVCHKTLFLALRGFSFSHIDVFLLRLVHQEQELQQISHVRV